MNKKIKTIITAFIFIISFCSIANASNWVLILDETNKKDVNFKVWVNTDRLYLSKTKYDPYSYITSDLLHAYIKYETTYKGNYINDGICDFTFCIDGSWYSSQGGPAYFRNAFGIFSEPEPAFGFRKMFYKRDKKIFKAVMEYWNSRGE